MQQELAANDLLQLRCQLHQAWLHNVLSKAAQHPNPVVHVDRHSKPEPAPYLWHEVTTAVGVVTDRQSQLYRAISHYS